MTEWILEAVNAVPTMGWVLVSIAALTTAVLDFIKWRAERKRREYLEF